MAQPGHAAHALPPPVLPQRWHEGDLASPGLEDTGVFLPHPPRELSKKHAFLDEKGRRPLVRIDEGALVRASVKRPQPPGRGPTATIGQPGARVAPVTTLYNVWTREALPIIPGLAVGESQFHGFLRDHFTNQSTDMDVRLVDVLAAAARRFDARRIEVVSGYRSPKYQLMLRKKGREVARQSQHCEGRAVDFRIRGVSTQVLLRFVRSLHRGGVGYYPQSQFVHCDTGPIRFWKGT